MPTLQICLQESKKTGKRFVCLSLPLGYRNVLLFVDHATICEIIMCNRRNFEDWVQSADCGFYDAASLAVQFNL